MSRRLFCRLALLVCCSALTLGAARAQGIGLDHISVGPILVHDHVRFDLHLHVKNDPYPHETKEGYEYDGMDWAAAVQWHWGRIPLVSTLRATPVSRLHPAYDQDTDFEPTTDSTHGNTGLAHSRTFALTQQIPVSPSISYTLGFLRQWTRYHDVTTYDLNTNPSLPSHVYERLISEQAILYELRSGLDWTHTCTCAGWTTTGSAGAVPLTAIYLHNYIPVVLAATSALAYGATGSLSTAHPLGAWRIELRADGGWFHGYRADAGFQRRAYAFSFTLSPPRFW